MKGDFGWLQQHIVVRPIVREDRAAMSKAERIKLNKLVVKATSFLRRNSRFVHLMKTIKSFAITFEMEYNEKSSATLVWTS